MIQMVFVKARPEGFSSTPLRAALSLRDKRDSVIAVSIGGEMSAGVLHRCLELGADEAVLLRDPLFAFADGGALSQVARRYVGIREPDLVLFGDGDTGTMPAEVAAMTCAQQFYYTVSLDRCAHGFIVMQDYGDEKRECFVPPGSVLSFPGAVDERPSAFGNITVLGASDIGLTSVRSTLLPVGHTPNISLEADRWAVTDHVPHVHWADVPTATAGSLPG